MTVLTTDSTTLDGLVPQKRQNSSSLKIAQSMSGRQICLCCSNPLLRHIWLGKLYWRCNHCYQAMPVMEDAQEMPLSVAHGGVFQQLLIFSKPRQKQQNCEQKNYERSIANLTVTPMIHSG